LLVFVWLVVSVVLMLVLVVSVPALLFAVLLVSVVLMLMVLSLVLVVSVLLLVLAVILSEAKNPSSFPPIAARSQLPSRFSFFRVPEPSASSIGLPYFSPLP
jgi:hypothetical protein